MRALALDASRRHAALAVLAGDEGRLLAARTARGPGAVERLLAAAADLLAGEFDAVVVAAGPGSYAGVRAAIAVAQGVAQARGLPVHTVGSLEVVAHAAPTGRGTTVHALADAGRGGLYVAVYARRDGRLDQMGPPARVEAASWRPRVGEDVAALEPLPAAVAVDPGDHAAALAAAAAAALRRPPVPPSAVRPVHAESPSRPGGRAPAPRVS